MSHPVQIRKWAMGLCAMAATLILCTTVLYILIPDAQAAEQQATGLLAHWGYYMAAAVATGLSSFGAGIAVSHVGAAAIAAISEKPEMLGRVLIFVGLAEGIAIYGLIISFIIIAAV
ncbi:MAG: ATP synthase subunit C [Mariprofundaceae bacterium]